MSPPTAKALILLSLFLLTVIVMSGCKSRDENNPPAPPPPPPAHAEKVLEPFADTAHLYIGGHGGSATGLIDSSIYAEDGSNASGGSSLKVEYSINAGEGHFAEVLRNYGTQTIDLSFAPVGLSLQLRGTPGSQELFRLMLFEDLDLDGNFEEAGEEIWSYDDATVLSTGTWTEANAPYSAFTRLAGSGNHTLDLHRIGKWRVRLDNTTERPVTGTLYLDDLRQLSAGTPPEALALLSGSWIQLSNNGGCACGEWSEAEWEAELELLAGLCQDTIYVHYSIYQNGPDSIAWYPSSLPWVTESHPTLDRLLAAAETVGMDVVLGLYFNEEWNRVDKSDPNIYNSLQLEQQAVIDELWSRYGHNPAFAGWYIPQEINDLEWPGDYERDLLANWLADVASHAKSKSTLLTVTIAPFFGPSQPADVLTSWWEEVLTTASEVDIVLVQDGVGTTRTDVDVDVPHYLAAMEDATTTHGRTFGVIVESFHQTAGSTEHRTLFQAEPTQIDTLKEQLAYAGRLTSRLVQFEWSYMQPSKGGQAAQLFADYQAYQQTITSCPR